MIGKVLIPTHTGLKVLDIISICYCKAFNKVTEIILENGQSYVLNKTLDDTKKLFPKAAFFRCHRSYIVNLYHVSEINKTFIDCLVLNNGTCIKLSRRKEKEFIDQFNSFQLN
ncbi:MAG: LytTR family DNA-binding domain-containing protein [Bacteroidales bacterium]|jgi:two-component system LytT family response regulator|nr:LytTR family DNA-binding domain-containing protein [Bacteroidales bacterium]